VNEKLIKIWLAIIGIASVGVIGITIAPALRAQSSAATIVTTPQTPPTDAVVTPTPLAPPTAAVVIPTPQASTPAASDVITRAQTSILETLRDPGSAQFSDMVALKNGRDTMVCGFVNAKNGYGGYTGRKRFIYSDGMHVSHMNVYDGQIAQVCQSLAGHNVGNMVLNEELGKIVKSGR